MNIEITQDQQMTTVGGKGIDKLRELSEKIYSFKAIFLTGMQAVDNSYTNTYSSRCESQLIIFKRPGLINRLII